MQQARHDRRRSLQPVELILGQRLSLARPAKLGHATGEQQHRGLEPRVRDRQRWPRGVGVHVGEDVVEGGEPHGELGGLGVEDGILGVDGKEALRGEAERGGDWRVLAAQMRSLRGEVVQVALLAHPRASGVRLGSIRLVRRCSSVPVAAERAAVAAESEPELPLPLEDAIGASFCPRTALQE